MLVRCWRMIYWIGWCRNCREEFKVLITQRKCPRCKEPLV